MANSSTVLVADSGSTKTDWLLMENGLPALRFQSAGMNPFYQTGEEINAILESEVVSRLTCEIRSIFFYGAGCADTVKSQLIRDALSNAVSDTGYIEVASDMLGAARALCGKQAGVACILGTGANNAFYDGCEIVRSVGSLGFWLGDEGSGSYLGKTFVVHFLQNELPSDLHNAFAQAFPEIDRLVVLENAYRKPFPNRYFASFSKFLAENVNHRFVQDMIGSAFDLFVEKYIMKHEGVQSYPIHFTGSIAYCYQDILKASLLRHELVPGYILKSPLDALGQYHAALEP